MPVVSKKYCEKCGSPMRLSLQGKRYDTKTGKLIGGDYFNECSRILCRWSHESSFQRLYIKEPENE